MRMSLKQLAVIVEIIAISIISAGIGIEVATGADAGYIIITSGSVLAAIGGFIWVKILRSNKEQS